MKDMILATVVSSCLFAHTGYAESASALTATSLRAHAKSDLQRTIDKMYANVRGAEGMLATHALQRNHYRPHNGGVLNSARSIKVAIGGKGARRRRSNADRGENVPLLWT